MPESNSGELIKFVRPSFLPGTELLNVYNSVRLWRMLHETYTFCACELAAASWQYCGKRHSLGDRGSMFMEPGEVHRTTEANKLSNFKVLFISPEVVADAARELGLPATPHLRIPNSDDPKLFWTLYRFSSALETGASILEQQTLFTACLRIILEHTEQSVPMLAGSNEHHAVELIKRYLKERYTEKVSLDDLVALTGLSRFHLVRIFAKRVGMPPHVYQINLRIARACTLIKAGVSPVNVSTDVGFADQSHFTRHFKNIWGITPTHYANAVRV